MTTEEAARRGREAEATRFELQFLCKVEVKERGWDEWRDTVGAVHADR